MAENTYLIQKSTLTDIADATRLLSGEQEYYTPIQIEEKIKELCKGLVVETTNHINPVTGKWERPQEWPNVENIDIASDFDGLYLTYDLTKTAGYGWIGLFVQNVTNNTPVYIERGHIEGTRFVSDEHFEMLSGQYFRQPLNEQYGNYQLWKVYSLDHIKTLNFASNSNVNSECLIAAAQPCVEQTGQLLYVSSLRGATAMSQGATATHRVTLWMESDTTAYKSVLSDQLLRNMYYQAVSLQNVDMSKWDTQNWNITSLNLMFSGCRNLRYLNFDCDTSNWSVQDMINMFGGCYSLRSFELNCDTTNWRVTNINNMFDTCISLETCKFNCNTLNWNVGSMQNVFISCLSLRSFILDCDTSNWTVTIMNSMFKNCPSLQTCKLNCNTSNWIVSNMNSMFAQCRSLRYFTFDCDTSNWEVTNIGSLFDGCYNLESFKFDCDTSNWAVTTMGYMLRSCEKIKTFILDCDTSNWKVTSIASMFSFCRALTDVVFDCDVSGWGPVSISELFYYCTSIEKIDIPTNLSLADTAMTSVFNYCGDVLKHFSGFRFPRSIGFTFTHELTKQSLLDIISNLPEVTNQTLTLGAWHLNKLTAEEIAVATAKGWTVA